MWQTQFGGDDRILTRTLQLDGAPYSVIGVMPPSFRFPTDNVALWLPLSLREEDFSNRQNTYLQAVGTVTEWCELRAGTCRVDGMFTRLARDYPETNEETGFSYFRQRDYVSPRNRLMISALLRR